MAPAPINTTAARASKLSLKKWATLVRKSSWVLFGFDSSISSISFPKMRGNDKNKEDEMQRKPRPAKNKQINYKKV